MTSVIISIALCKHKKSGSDAMLLEMGLCKRKRGKYQDTPLNLNSMHDAAPTWNGGTAVGASTFWESHCSFELQHGNKSLT